MAWLEITIDTDSKKINSVATRLTGMGFAELVIEDQEEFETFLEGNRDYWDYIDEDFQEKLKGLSHIKLYLEDTETAALARSVPDNGGVYFVPAFTGLGSPYRDPDAKGVMVGLTAATTRGHIVRATLESIAYQVSDILAAMEADSGIRITELRCDGGAAQNEFLMQFQADVLGLPVLAAEESDATALGAALAAALGHGDITQDEIAALPRAFHRYEPKLTACRRALLQAGWQDALARSRGKGI